MWKKDVKESGTESSDVRKTQLSVGGFEIEEEATSQGMQAASGN